MQRQSLHLGVTIGHFKSLPLLKRVALRAIALGIARALEGDGDFEAPARTGSVARCPAERVEGQAGKAASTATPSHAPMRSPAPCSRVAFSTATKTIITN
jgi:hypothetical protein